MSTQYYTAKQWREYRAKNRDRIREQEKKRRERRKTTITTQRRVYLANPDTKQRFGKWAFSASYGTMNGRPLIRMA